jgi:hypothetical protein
MQPAFLLIGCQRSLPVRTVSTHTEHDLFEETDKDEADWIGPTFGRPLPANDEDDPLEREWKQQRMKFRSRP